MLPGILLQDKEDPFLQAIQEPDDASHKGVIIMISFAEVKEAIRLRAEEDRKDRFRSLNQTQGVEAKMKCPGIISKRSDTAPEGGGEDRKDRFRALNQTQRVELFLSQYHPSQFQRSVYQTGKQMLQGFSCKIKKFQDNPFRSAIQEPDDASHKGIIIMISFVEVKEAIRLRGEDRFRALNQTQRVEVKMKWPGIL
ncbi:hypothetical protein CDAR_246021 [Caerostris darwini]|uniref:RRM domain-containing protein n=1 Tax=Caerostris darwini TaxID=1538125 RepID=A0AAV4QKE9_9ARAC|nr:hypothetical protein CDAR_246021 [Caerostris darwini]